MKLDEGFANIEELSEIFFFFFVSPNLYLNNDDFKFETQNILVKND